LSKSVYWIQCGACGGDSMALLGSNDPDLIELPVSAGVEFLWHPTLSNGSEAEHRELLAAIDSGDVPLDILVVEGAVVTGPDGTGRFDQVDGVPRKDLVARLASRAEDVVAAGTCAGFGGVVVDGGVGGTGLQFHREAPGGFLGEEFRAGSGRPVINLPGCPAPPWVVAEALIAVSRGTALTLNEFHMPEEWYGMLVHQGCTRNEYHEFRVEDADFGSPGCLYFHLGCLGPLTYASCNKALWVGRTSRTRAGVPCVGCARPDFPRPYPFFLTRALEGVPLDLPVGVDRAHFMAYKIMAEAAAPERLRSRTTKV